MSFEQSTFGTIVALRICYKCLLRKGLRQIVAADFALSAYSTIVYVNKKTVCMHPADIFVGQV